MCAFKVKVKYFYIILQIYILNNVNEKKIKINNGN